MKKYLSNILVSTFLLTILVGAGGSVLPQITYAQESPDCSASNPLAYLNPLCGPLTSTGRNQAASAVAGEVAGEVIATIVAPISLLILRITSLLTILSGGILNFVVDHTIVKMSENYKEIGAISSAWGTVRDVANMGFIFILLYASIQMILGEGKDTRKLIVNIIIAALLINFSLFFTQVVIDAANIIALTFYHAIAPTAVPGNWTDAGLSNSLMAPLHFETIWNMKSTLTNGNIAVIGVMGSVITLIAAFIFFAVALMLVIRYVVLILVLILSPIAFIGDVIPGAGGYAKDWRKALFGQAFFAPVYMFLTWITIKLFNDSSMFPTAAGKSWANAFGGEATANTASAAFSGSSIALVFNFVVITVFLIATLILSKKVSDSAGQGINKLTSKALGYAGGATLGVAGRMGRGTIGRFGAGVASSERLKDLVAKGGAGGMAARLAMAAGEKTAKKSFDLRGSGLGDVLEGGKAKSGGFAKDEEARQKAATARAKSLKPRESVLNAAKFAEAAAQEKLESARNRAGIEFDSDAAKQAALRMAEKEHESAKEEALKPKSLNETVEESNARSTRLEEAEEKLRAEREKLDALRKEHVEQSTEKEAREAEEAAARQGDLLGRPGKYAQQRETDIFGTRGIGGNINTSLGSVANKIRESELGRRKGALGYLTRKAASGITIVGRSAGLRQEEREAQANAVRKSLKEKTKEEKALDAIAEAAKERLEKEEKDKKDNN